MRFHCTGVIIGSLCRQYHKICNTVYGLEECPRIPLQEMCGGKLIWSLMVLLSMRLIPYAQKLLRRMNEFYEKYQSRESMIVNVLAL